MKCDISSIQPCLTRRTLSKYRVVSIAVSKLDCINRIFVEPEAKINGRYTAETCCCCRSRLLHWWIRDFSTATQCSFYAVRHSSSSVLTCARAIVLAQIRWIIASGKECTSSTIPGCGGVAAAARDIGWMLHLPLNVGFVARNLAPENLPQIFS